MSVQLTETAARHVHKFLSTQPDTIGLRLGVQKTGCSGWGYTVDLATSREPGDHAFEDNGVLVLINEASLDKLVGVTVDFRQTGLNRQFVFDNPNAAEACGCGESFTTDEVVSA